MAISSTTNKSLKVCMLVHQDYYIDGRVTQYAESLYQEGVLVDVICVQPDEERMQAPITGVKVYPIPIKHGAGGQIELLWEYFLSMILYSIWLLALFIKKRYHVIHVHNMPDFLIFSAVLPKLLGCKLILDVHDPSPEFYISKYGKSIHSPMVKLMRFQEMLSAGLANAVIAANPNFKRTLAGRGIPENKITVITNQPDLKIFDRARFEPERRKPRSHFTLLYPGTITALHGLDIPVRSLPYIVDKIKNLRLLIIGAYSDYIEELKKIARELGVTDYVEFHPAIPLHEVPRAMSQADAGIYTGQADAGIMNIFVPVKVLQYAVMGLPIIASRIGGLIQLFPEDAILYFDPGDVRGFADCVLRLYENPELKVTLAQKADEAFVQKFNWQNEKKTYMALLHRLAA